MTTIPGNSSTTQTLALGGTRTSAIDFAGDRDWFAFEVDADQFVEVSLSANGFGRTLDTVLRVRDADGRLIDENDDISGFNFNSELTFFASAGETYYLEAAGYEASSTAETGRYTLSAAPATAPVLVDSLIWGSQWSDPTITYYFAADGETHPDADGISSDGFNAYEREQFLIAFTALSAVANITFEEVSDPDDADFFLILDDDEIIELPSNQQYAGSFSITTNDQQAVGLFNAAELSWDRSPGGGLTVGGDGYATIAHELLHGMGLAHPHDDGGASDVLQGVTSPFDDFGDFDLNQGVFTSLSYNTGYRSGDDTAPTGVTYGFDAGPMAIDIAALQQLYGANTETAKGDDTYVLPEANVLGTAWKTIWDNGGTDTVQFGGTRNVTIDLRDATLVYGVGGGGFVSHAAGIQGGLTIAQGVVIENAIGGSGNDMLMGNAVANVLTGNNGNDTLFGGLGDDVLDGGRNRDVLMGGGGADTILAGLGRDMAYGQSGGDTISATAGDNTLYGGSGFDEIVSGADEDTVHAGSGDDDIQTGAGADVLFGGRGRDTLNGGANNDLINGGMDADQLIGGGGSDQFVFSFVTDSLAGTQTRDTIVDFEASDRINLSAIDADFTVSGNQALAFIDTNAFSANAAEVRLQSISGGDVVVEIDQNGDGVADMEILVLNASLDVDDFIL